MLDRENGFRDDDEFAGEKEIVDADDGAGEGIFDWSEKSVGSALFDRAKGGIKRGAGNRSDGRPEELESGFFAESTGLALEGDAHLQVASFCGAHELVCLGEWTKLRRHGLNTVLTASRREKPRPMMK